MLLKQFRGGVATFRDGSSCSSFKVFASSEADAKRALNNILGWRWFSAETKLKEFGSTRLSGPQVFLKFQKGEAWQLTEVPRRAGRLPERTASPATRRVQKSVLLLKESGGHRSTVRYGKQTWEDLKFLLGHFGLNQQETLDKLIRERASQIKAKEGT